MYINLLTLATESHIVLIPIPSYELLLLMSNCREDSGMSATQQHFLKRELLKLQIESEVLKFNDATSLRHFGYPFSPSDPSHFDKISSDALSSSSSEVNNEFPLTKFAFTNFMLSFPLLSKSHQDWDALWVHKVQVLYEKFMSMDMSSTIDREEATKRKKIATKLNSLLLVIFNSGIGTVNELNYYNHDQLEEVGEKMNSDNINELLFPTKENLKSYLSQDRFTNGIMLNVSGVRQVKKLNNKLLATLNLTKTHYCYYEFIICSKMDLPQAEEVYVGRRYSDFRNLHHQLKKKFPGKHLPSLPVKVKSEFAVESSSPEDEDINDFERDSHDDKELTKQHMNEVKQTLSALLEELNVDDSQITEIMGSKYNKDTLESNTDSHHRKSSSIFLKKKQRNPMNLIRERTRVSLRSYIRKLIEDVEISQCDIFKEFLNKGKILMFSNEEIVDIRMRENVDLLQLMNQVQFQKEAYKKILELKSSSLPLKSQMLESDSGIAGIFSEFKTKKDINDLSPPLRNFVTWSEIEIAATIYQMFLANDNSGEFFSQIKRLHRLVPYSIIYQILKFTNPMLIMKAMIELLMSNPFGGKSLLQTLFYSILNDDIKHQEQKISELEAKVDEKALIKKIKFVVFENRDESLLFDLKSESSKKGDDYLFVLLTTHRLDGISGFDKHSHKTLYDSYAEYKRLEKVKSGKCQKEDIHFINHEKLELYSTLKQLLKLYTKSHDKAILQQLWVEPELTSLLKDIFTMFYQPLVTLFRNSHVEVAFKHFEKFMDDLIEVITSLQRNIHEHDTSEIIDRIMGVLQRHENKFYTFLNEVYANDEEGLFDGIIQWTNNLLNFLRKGKSGKGSPGYDLRIDFEDLFKRYPELNRSDILMEVDQIIARTKQARDKVKMSLEQTSSGPGGESDLIEESWKAINTQTEVFKASDFGINEIDLIDDNEDEDGDIEMEDETDLSGNYEQPKNDLNVSTAISSMLGPFKDEVICVLKSYVSTVSSD